MSEPEHIDKLEMHSGSELDKVLMPSLITQDTSEGGGTGRKPEKTYAHTEFGGIGTETTKEMLNELPIGGHVEH